MLENTRRLIFWTADTLRQKPVRKHYEDIVNILKGDCDSQDERLHRILKYAIQNVPFYKDITEPDISRFPVMSKPVYKEQGNRCRSKEYLDDDKLFIASTSGSTGTPLVVYQDANKKARMRADLIAAHEAVGWHLGDHYVFIRNWVSNYKQSLIKNFAQNVENISVTDFDDKKKAWLCEHLEQNPNSIIFGYASSVYDFLTYVRKEKIEARKLSVKLIVCDSDELTSANRKALEDTFDCIVINRYDNEENGLLAISSPHKDELTVNYPSLYVELLKLDSDESVQPGEMGRVVVTDLFNHAMPLIRYDIGDLAVSPDEAGKIRTLSCISGRKADCVYSTDGKIISAVTISGITEVFDTIVRYQLVQISKIGFEFHYVGKIGENDMQELSNRLHTALGTNAEIRYIIEQDIPLGKNGKAKTTVYAAKE